MGNEDAHRLCIQHTDNTMWCDGPHSAALERAEAFHESPPPELGGDFEVCPKCLELARMAKELQDDIAEHLRVLDNRPFRIEFTVVIGEVAQDARQVVLEIERPTDVPDGWRVPTVEEFIRVGPDGDRKTASPTT